MIIRKVKLSNAGPFLGDWEVELSEGTTVVVAEYDGEESRSNRAGKSYFAVDSALYAYFGWFRGSKVEDFPHRLASGVEDAFVEHEVESSDGTLWTIRRGRRANGDPIRELNGARVGDKELAKVVESEIVGLSFDEYRMTCAFIQNDINAFMKLSPEGKRRFVAPWFKTDRWVPRADLATKRLNRKRRRAMDIVTAITIIGDIAEDIDEAREEFESSKNFAARARKLANSASKKFHELERRFDRAEDEAELLQLRSQHDEISELIAASRGKIAAELNSASRSVSDAKLAVSEARTRKVRMDDLERRSLELQKVKEESSKIAADLKLAKADLEIAEKKRAALLKTYKELKNSRTGVCPILKKPCDEVALNRSDVSEIKSEGLEARKDLDRVKSLVNELIWKADMATMDSDTADEELEELSTLKRLSHVDVETDRLNAAESRLRDIERRAERLKFGRTSEQRELKRLEKRINELEIGLDRDGDQEALKQARNESSRAEAESIAAEELVGECRARLGEVLDKQRRLKELEAESKIVSGEVEKLAWAAYAFGANGIPSRELENAFGVAEDEMNGVLEDLQTSTRVQFSPTRELKEWEPACLACGQHFQKGERKHICRECGTPRRKRKRDELRLDVLDGPHRSSFDLDSGGGQVLLSVGTRVGLARLPGRHRAVRCEHLIIDEPDGALDAPNRELLHNLLRTRIQKLGIRQVILITHADVRREFDQAVVVQRFPDEDYSAVWNG